MVTKRLKQLFIETLSQIYWLLPTGFTNVEMIIIVLMSLLDKLDQKMPTCISYEKGLSDSKMKPKWYIKFHLWEKDQDQIYMDV